MAEQAPPCVFRPNLPCAYPALRDKCEAEQRMIKIAKELWGEEGYREVMKALSRGTLLLIHTLNNEISPAEHCKLHPYYYRK